MSHPAGPPWRVSRPVDHQVVRGLKDYRSIVARSSRSSFHLRSSCHERVGLSGSRRGTPSGARLHADQPRAGRPSGSNSSAPGRTSPPLVATTRSWGYGCSVSATSSSPTLGLEASAVSMKLTPSSTARRSTARAWFRSGGSPQIPRPAMRIAPKPKFTVMSPRPSRRQPRSPRLVPGIGESFHLTGAQPVRDCSPASQTASQSVQHPAIIWVHPWTSFTPSAAMSGVSEITDTEEVTGSNPVSPPVTPPVRSHFFDRGRAFGAGIG
jgi:hypothetical protein